MRGLSPTGRPWIHDGAFTHIAAHVFTKAPLSKCINKVFTCTYCTYQAPSKGRLSFPVLYICQRPSNCLRTICMLEDLLHMSEATVSPYVWGHHVLHMSEVTLYSGRHPVCLKTPFASNVCMYICLTPPCVADTAMYVWRRHVCLISSRSEAIVLHKPECLCPPCNTGPALQYY